MTLRKETGDAREERATPLERATDFACARLGSVKGNNYAGYTTFSLCRSAACLPPVRQPQRPFPACRHANFLRRRLRASRTKSLAPLTAVQPQSLA